MKYTYRVDSPSHVPHITRELTAKNLPFSTSQYDGKTFFEFENDKCLKKAAKIIDKMYPPEKRDSTRDWNIIAGIIKALR